MTHFYHEGTCQGQAVVSIASNLEFLATVGIGENYLRLVSAIIKFPRKTGDTEWVCSECGKSIPVEKITCRCMNCGELHPIIRMYTLTKSRGAYCSGCIPSMRQSTGENSRLLSDVCRKYSTKPL